MAIVFEANYSKKLGLPGYSSHQYSVTIRTEVASVEHIQEESSRIYKLLQESVDHDIQHPGFLPPEVATKSKGNGNDHHEVNGLWKCSDKQRDLILRIVEDNKLDKQEIENLSLDRFGRGVKELNKLEASGLIDELLEKYGNKDRSRGSRQQDRRYQPRGAR